jgi:hypothetical protein
VTVGEFRSILEQLYSNGWTLVDIHRAVDGDVRVPAGRKPLVLSEDDVNYYDDTRPRGVGCKLALDAHGAVKVEVHDQSGVLSPTTTSCRWSTTSSPGTPTSPPTAPRAFWESRDTKACSANASTRPRSDIDIVPRFTRGNGVTIMTRLHIDGVAFQDGAKRLAPFFDVATVEDRAARS